MKPAKSVFGVILAGVFLTSMTCGCAQTESSSTADSGTSTVTSNASDASAPESGALDQLEGTENKLYDDTVVDMEGYEFVIANPWMNRTPPDNAGLSERLIHQRIDEVEKEYHCKITITDFYGGMEALMPRIMAGDKVADIISMLPEMWIPCAGAGYLRPWDDVASIINPNDTRWLVGQSNATLGGKRYIMQYERPNDAGAVVLWYNKDVLKSAGIEEDPAEMVLEGTWTWDVFREMLQKTTNASVNQYGFGWVDSYANPARALAASNGAQSVTLDDSGNYVATYTDQKYIDALNFLDQIVNVDKTMKVYTAMRSEATWGNVPPVETMFTSFERGLTAFMSGRIWYGSVLKAMEGVNYGMVVYPKGPSADGYTSLSNTLGGYAMTSTNPDYEKTAIIFRAIARPVEDFEDVDILEEEIVSDFFMDGDELSRQMMQLEAENSLLDVGYSILSLQTAVDRAALSSIFWQETTVAAAIQAISGAYDQDIKDAFAKLP